MPARVRHRAAEAGLEHIARRQAVRVGEQADHSDEQVVEERAVDARQLERMLERDDQPLRLAVALPAPQLASERGQIELSPVDGRHEPCIGTLPRGLSGGW